MTEKKRPKTQPTGYNPTPGKKVVKVEQADEVAVSAFDMKMALVRICYTQERRRWETLKAGKLTTFNPSGKYNGTEATKTKDGDEHPEGKPARNSVWGTLVTWCESRDINPEEYIRACFFNMPMQHLAPEPHLLMGPKYINKWAEFVETLDERLLIALDGQKTLAKARIDFNHYVLGEPYIDACLAALGAGDLQLSSLFRYCAAKNMKHAAFNHIASVYRAEAILQLECYHDAYVRVWGKTLPKGFAKAAKLLYPKILLEMGYRLTNKPKT
jgi:hypothetical protein